MKRNLISRRQFLSTVTAGTGTMILAGATPTLASPTRISSDPFQIIKLGKSGLKTSLIGIGTGSNGGKRQSNQTRIGKEKAESLFRYVYDKGIRFYDCADLYGTHPYVTNALKGLPREKFTLCTKIWERPGGIPESDRPDANIVVDRFRKELNTDYIDLVQLHCMVDADWTTSMKNQMDLLSDLKSKGIVRAHGVSVHSLEAMNAALASDWVDVIHVRINPYGIAMDTPEPEEVVAVIHELHNSGKGVIGMKLVGNGNFRDDSDKIDNSLRFVLGLGSVNMMIVGFEDESQIDDYSKRVKTTLTAMI
jgi:aryl-alcohol dehydrogenase-like predicted oxidoreductase